MRHAPACSKPARHTGLHCTDQQSPACQPAIKWSFQAHMLATTTVGSVTECSAEYVGCSVTCGSFLSQVAPAELLNMLRAAGQQQHPSPSSC
jgi:hypothetical protein